MGGNPKLRKKLEELEKAADYSVTPLSYDTLAVPILLVAFGGTIAIVVCLVEIMLGAYVISQVFLREVLGSEHSGACKTFKLCEVNDGANNCKASQRETRFDQCGG